MKLENGQVAVITGGASGIGLALAQALGARGLRLMLADVEPAALDAARQQLAGAGCDVAAEVTDVADPAACERLAAATAKRFGAVDLLVNNAGVGGVLGPVWTTDARDWRWTFDVNLFGVVHGVQAIMPAMVTRGRGHVVNIASMAGLATFPFLAGYAASKHAVVALSESLAGELAALGIPIKVSVVCPGTIATRILDSERNRPEHLRAASKTPPELVERLRAAFRERGLSNPMPAPEAAARILAGIERDDFLILTHHDHDATILGRLASVEQAVRRMNPLASD